MTALASLKITEFCNRAILVMLSVNEENVLLVPNGYPWGPLEQNGKIEAHAAWVDPSDPTKVFIVWKKGQSPQIIHAERVLFRGDGGSSFNVVSNLRRLGMTNLTIACLVAADEAGKRIQNKLQTGKNPVDFIPLACDQTAKTFIFQKEDRPEAVTVMVKPRNMALEEGTKDLLKWKWDAIIATSVRPNMDLLQLVLSVAEENPKAIMSLIPSLTLMASLGDDDLRRVFLKILRRVNVFHVNDSEAGRFIGLSENDTLGQRDMIIRLAKKLPAPDDDLKRLIFLTLGSSGAAAALLARKSMIIPQASRNPKGTALSTSGLGDAFHAAAMRVLIEAGMNTPAKVRAAAFLGAELAASVITTYASNLMEGKVYFTPATMTKLINSQDFSIPLPGEEDF